jgi:beta-glucosidase
MTDDERFTLISSLMVNVFGTGKREPRVPSDLPTIAGYVSGVPRLKVPPLKLADASLGMRDTGGPSDFGTALPAGLALGATFNPALARQGGAIVATELKARGFNVALSGGINLVREVRNGRNFEYISEDPLLSALMGAELVNGTQAQGVIGILKHVSLNASETNKFFLDAVIDPAAHRESDLLAFEIAIERSNPGALMCAYNKVNGAYACGNDPILNGVVKQAWGYKGWIMSDWKAVYNWDYALKGLDQHSGAQLDEKEWFNTPLREAYAAGKVPKSRISDMVRRILRSMYVAGIDQWGPLPKVDPKQHNEAALEVARQGIVLLKNDNVLPVAKSVKTIAVIGGYAQIGVISGDGSSQVKPYGGYAAQVPMRSHPILGPTTMRLAPSSPLKELQRLLPDATIAFDPGEFRSEAIALAKQADLVLFFAFKHEGERYDSPDLTLPRGQDELISAVAAVNPKTVVVLQTGNPVSMPWQRQVAGIVQAWYPGQAGGQAIAEVLTGAVNPSGKLPITFPVSVDQTPFPVLPGSDREPGKPMTVNYREGAEIGYRWFAKTGAKPLYSFGYGLSYTTFDYANLQVTGGKNVKATVTVRNSGNRTGATVPQLYLVEAPGERRQRLLAFQRVELQPGESRSITLEADPRLLAKYRSDRGRWVISGGQHQIFLGTDAQTAVGEATVQLAPREFGR